MKKSIFDASSIRSYLMNRCRQLGISMQQLYNVSPIHRTTIQRWWNGTPPSLASLKKLEQTLDLLEEQKKRGEIIETPDSTENGDFSRFLKEDDYVA